MMERRDRNEWNGRKDGGEGWKEGIGWKRVIGRNGGIGKNERVEKRRGWINGGIRKK